MISDTLNNTFTSKNDINSLKAYERKRYLELNQKII